MQTDYLKRAEEEQKKYQQIQDPFKLGQDVTKRRFSEIMSTLDTQQAGIQQSYSDRYLQQQRAFRNQAAAGRPTFSGGMAQQGRDFLTAAEQSALTQTMNQGMSAEAQLSLQRQSAMSNAMLEGQQATQMQLQNQQAQLQLIQQREAILASDLTDEQKAEQLAAIGVDPQSVPASARAGQGTTGGAVGMVALTGSVIGTKVAAKVGTAQLAAATKAVGTTAAKEAIKKQVLKEAGNLTGAKATAYLKTKGGKDAIAAATNKAITSKLGWTGKIAQSVSGKSGLKFAGALAKTALGKFFKWALPVWLVVSSIETIAEAAGLNEGRGFSGYLTKEGSWADKALEFIGL